jgi:predicted XRE-type DNA-binding protein
MAVRNTDNVSEEDLTIIEGSENIFADLGLPDAEEYYAKAQLAYAIRDVLAARGLSQRKAAAIVGVAQPDLSAIVRGRLMGFTMDRLTTILNRLDQDVEITIRPKRGRHARTHVETEWAGSPSMLAASVDRRD